MQFTNSLEVPLPPDRAWPILLDISRILPCLPGAELSEQVDERTYKGKVSVRLGPVTLAFTGTATFEEIDDAALRATVKARGADTKGRGSASANSQFHLEPIPSGTKVVITTDLNLTGSIAQYGRSSGMIQEVAAELIRQFAGNLRAEIARTQAAPASGVIADAADTAALPPAPTPARPISGLSLMLRVFLNRLRRLFGLGPAH